MIAVTWLAACAGDPSRPGDTDQPDPTITDTGEFEVVPFDPMITTTDNGDGTSTSIVSATSETEWAYVSLVQGGVLVGETDPWDLKFRREVIAVNGGVSGGGDGEGAVLEAVDFDAVRYPPVAGWFTDLEDANADGRPDGPFAGWFAYDISDHTLSPTDQCYVVRASAGAWRIRMDSYYWEGHSGWPTFTWGPLETPGPLVKIGDDTLQVDATADRVWVSLVEQVALVPPDPAASDDWDLGFLGTEIATNGGISGVGGRSAARLGEAFAAVTAVPPAPTFTEDAPDADADGIPEYAVHDAWLTDGYGAVTAAPDVTFVLARPDATHAKFSLSAYDADGTPGFPAFQLGEL